jgi:hypothetical protein
MNCAICKSEISDNEPIMTFRESSVAPEQTMHACCCYENFLFEVWNSLSLGSKYESGCKHVDYTSRFNPATFTPEDVAKAVEKQLKTFKQRPHHGGKKWWKR